MEQKKILICSDFASPTGFATVSENIARYLSKNWEVHVLAINYYGDPHPLQSRFKMYPASLNGDVHGFNRIVQLIQGEKFDLIFMINDIWIIDMFLSKIKQARMKREEVPPIVWYTPVDAVNIKKGFVEPLNQTQHGIAYTEFGKNEILKGGLTIPIDVIPHGVNTNLFHFMPRKEARKETGIPEEWFVVLNVSRNQPRKRLDLLMYYFSEWIRQTDKPENVKLYYHGALQDIGYDIEDLAQYWKIDDRLIVTHRDMTMNNMLPKDKLKYIYNAADIYTHVCAAEGWNLPLMECMACAIPCLVPNSSAMAEWPKGSVEYIECYDNLPFVNTGGVNTIMDTPRLDSFIEKMELLYNDAQLRKDLGYKGFKKVTASKYQWETIAAQFNTIFQSLVQSPVQGKDKE